VDQYDEFGRSIYLNRLFEAVEILRKAGCDMDKVFGVGIDKQWTSVQVSICRQILFDCLFRKTKLSSKPSICSMNTHAYMTTLNPFLQMKPIKLALSTCVSNVLSMLKVLLKSASTIPLTLAGDPARSMNERKVNVKTNSGNLHFIF
jgi:hypothetical protein